jgi:hypothetical protein
MGIRFMSMEVSNIKAGMKNAETTLDNLAILCLDGKTDDLEDGMNIFIKITPPI